MFIKVALIFILILPSVLASPKIDKLLSQMSLEEKAAQLILIGFRGQSVSESESIIFDVAKVKVGSVILFDYDAQLKTRGRNIKNSQQLKKLTHDLQTISSIPLFISIDEEGGLVTRLKKAYGFKTKKSAMELGKGSLKGTYIQARILADELSSHGINLNFAPVVDVNVNPHNPVIGSVKRSFSDDEKIVSAHAAKFIQGQSDEGVLSALKHFPGHGSSKADSHLGMVDVTYSWEERELTPYRNLIEQNLVDLIMSAHVYQRDLDQDYPATLSYKILTEVLRGQLNYKGVVISDDMNMGAIKDHFGQAHAIELALNAGVDILLFGNNIHYEKMTGLKVRNTIVDLVKKGKVSENSINAKVKRVLLLKEKEGLLQGL